MTTRTDVTDHKLTTEALELADLVESSDGEVADIIRALVAENKRLARDRDIYLGGIELLVQQEVISAGRARELHGMTPEEQRQYWRDNHYKWRPE